MELDCTQTQVTLARFGRFEKFKGFKYTVETTHKGTFVGEEGLWQLEGLWQVEESA